MGSVEESNQIAQINYYCRERYYRQMQNVALTGMKRFGNDPVMKFFNAFAMVLEERLQEGMRELDSLKEKNDVNVCAMMCLIYAHKRCRDVDAEAVQYLDAKIKEQRKLAGERGLYLAGLFLFHTGRHDKAREYIDRMLKMNPDSKEGLVLKGWIDLMCGREAYIRKSVKYFDDAMSKDPHKDMDALLGKAKYLELRRNYSGALEFINQAVVAFPSFSSVLVEKMKLQLASQDWEQTVETANRALLIDAQCIEAQRFLILHQLCREGDYTAACASMMELCHTMDKVETRNAGKFYELSQVFARVCGRNASIVKQTVELAQRAVNIDNNTADYLNELAYQMSLLGENKDAMRCYKNAMKLDETSVTALTGIIRCQLDEDHLEDAAQQLEFLSEIQQSIGRTADGQATENKDLLYLRAVLARKRLSDADTVVKLLDEAVDHHMAGVQQLSWGPEYYLHLNPDFLLQVVHEYMMFAPVRPESVGGEAVNPLLVKCMRVLDAATRAVPGLMDALCLLGRVKFIAGDFEAAQTTLQRCVDMDPTMSGAHLLLSEIYLHSKKYQHAQQSLEMALSHNFRVRDHPTYHLIQALIHKETGKMEEALKTLQTAMMLPGVKKRDAHRSVKSGSQQISLNDRVSVYLELSEIYRLQNAQHEAAKVMQDAINEFQGTTEENRINIANADLSLARGDTDTALSMLRQLAPGQAYFIQARKKMADIYLHHRKDRKLYAACYKELVDKYPSHESYILLGDAYMSIQEPEKAIDVYQSAMKKNPRDGQLASKIGQALVKTHYYSKALTYYENALKTCPYLRYDLSELLLKLRQYDKAEKVLKQALEYESQVSDLQTMLDEGRYLVLLAKVYQRQDRNDEALTALNKAASVQTRVLKRVQLEQPDALSAQKKFAASICCQMAEMAYNRREYDAAIKNYTEALNYNDADHKIMLELARLYLTIEDLDGCQHQCMTILKEDTENDAATVMLADLMFRRNDYKTATHHFQQMLARKPDHYKALARLVDLMRRAGRLEDIPAFLDQAEKASSKAAIEPGFNYCKGLYAWYSGKGQDALLTLNKCRLDAEWSQVASYTMIQICLNPDSKTIGGEVFQSMNEDENAANAQAQDNETQALATANKLIRELKAKPNDLKPKLLENLALIQTKNKSKVEKALASFTEIATQEKDHVGALLGMAQAYMMLKQNPRARNQLKRVAKNVWNIEDAEDLEKSWLLLADIYIQNGKYDMATELLKRCLQHNLSCWKAYEYMGYINEKEQSYKDAALNYENAWKYGNKNNPVIGFKLGFNYLKAKRYADAIDICHHVIANHPDYPRIRKDVLDKARAALRV